jgi:hypothetical protein
LAEGLGLFVIELKSINLSAIKEINGDNGLILHDYVKSSTKKPAWLQAIDAAESLQNKIQATPAHREMLRELWIAPGASLFRIHRQGFLARFGPEPQFRHAADELAGGMIFAEDLSDGRTFLKRLEYVKAHPLYKAAPNRRKDKPALYDGATATSLDVFIRFKLTPAETLTASEMARLRRIEDEEKRHLDQINPDHHVILLRICRNWEDASRPSARSASESPHAIHLLQQGSRNRHSTTHIDGCSLLGIQFRSFRCISVVR